MKFKPNEICIIGNDGHGMETIGKRTPKFKDGTFIHENEFNTPTKNLFFKECKRQGFEVYDVSPETTDTPLSKRTNRANTKYLKKEFKVYIYTSFHFNAMHDFWENDIGGIETYHYPTSSTGKKLASCIHKQLLKGTKIRNRGVKPANFHELRETQMTAVLLECGFMTNVNEAKLMTNIAYQMECAIETCKGVCDYFGIKYKEEEKHNESELDRITKIVSPVYYDVWLKHFSKNSKFNWEGFIKSALKK